MYRASHVWIGILVGVGCWLGGGMAGVGKAAEGVEAVEAVEESGARVARKFEVQPGGTLRLRSDRGNVTLSGGDRSTVEIEVERRAVRVSGEKARRLLEGHEVHFDREGDTIRVDARWLGPERWLGWGSGLEVTIRVLLPRSFDVVVETGGGSVTASSLSGDLVIRTSGGSLKLESLAGKVRGRTSGGSITAVGMEGEVDLETSGGGITVRGAKGTRLGARTSGGSLRLSELALPVEARTSGGSIQLETTATPVVAETSAGTITAELRAVPRDEVRLKTSAGSIHLIVPREAAFQLDASTSAGRVSCDLPVERRVEGKSERSVLRGSVGGGGGGGGPLIRLRTSAGSIRVKAGERGEGR